MDPSSQEKKSDRREFLRACGCALAGLAFVGLAPVVGGCELSEISQPPAGGGGGGGNGKTVEIDVSALTSDGSFVLSEQRGPDRKKIFVARLAEATYTALSTECPHSGFAVMPAGGVLLCTGGQGHGSTFDYEGTALTGPALPFGGLREYPLTYDAARRVVVVTIG